MEKSTKLDDTWAIEPFTLVARVGKLWGPRNEFAKLMAFGRIKSLFAKNEVSSVHFSSRVGTGMLGMGFMGASGFLRFQLLIVRIRWSVFLKTFGLGVYNFKNSWGLRGDFINKKKLESFFAKNEVSPSSSKLAADC